MHPRIVAISIMLGLFVIGLWMSTFRYAANDGGLVCISAAPVTLTPSGDKLIIKYPGGYRMTLVRQDNVPSPWPTNDGPTGACDGALDGV